MKKIFFILQFFFILNLSFSQDLKVQFLKGNITEKTAAVREGSGQDGKWLTEEAMSFILKNKEYLENDRDLAALAVATVLSITPDYILPLNSNEKENLINNLIKVFNAYSESNNVQIAVISKIVSLDKYLPTASFLAILNNYLIEVQPQNADSSILHTVISAVGEIGNNISFTILYNSLYDRRFANYTGELENSIIKLIPNSRNEVLQIVRSKDISKINKILALIQKNSQISQNFLSEVAENVLNETILMIDNSSDKNELVNLQIYALQILNDNKWTRASKTVLSFFELAKKEFKDKLMKEEHFVQVISSLMNIAPIDSVSPLIKYLGELNSQVENNIEVSQNVALSVINTLGAIGDKSAFDTLLSVTYLDYSESVLSAARKALAGLRW